MKFTQALKMALSSIMSNKLRSFLTMLGVIIGVFSVTVLVSLGEGATAQISSQIEELGTNLITVSVMNNTNKTIEMEDLDELSQSPDIAAVAPVSSGNLIVKAGNNNMTTKIEATVPEYTEVRNVNVSQGRFIVENDIDKRFRVAVIGVDVADELYATRDVIGKTISINRSEFKIVGVLEEKGSSMAGSNDDKVVIPLSTGQRLLKNTKIRQFFVSAESSESVDKAMEKLDSFMIRKLKDEEAYNLFDQSSLLDTISETTATMTLMLGGIAGISLLVGGIGIMNIMLVSVTERTREIGIRKAIGAKRRDILIQFMIESVVISVLGGIIGILFGVLGSSVLGNILNMTTIVSASVVMLATGFSIVVGVVFGLYPANKASKLRPIEALRYE